jgi:hypothetical protein
MCYDRRRAEACVDESAHHALKGYPTVESTNLAFCDCRKTSQNARRGSCVIAPCIGGRAGRGRDGPVRPQ